MFSEVAEIALVAARLGQFQQLLKTQVILILNFTRPYAITYTNRTEQKTFIDMSMQWSIRSGALPTHSGTSCTRCRHFSGWKSNLSSSLTAKSKNNHTHLNNFCWTKALSATGYTSAISKHKKSEGLLLWVASFKFRKAKNGSYKPTKKRKKK